MVVNRTAANLMVVNSTEVNHIQPLNNPTRLEADMLLPLNTLIHPVEVMPLPHKLVLHKAQLEEDIALEAKELLEDMQPDHKLAEEAKDIQPDLKEEVKGIQLVNKSAVEVKVDIRQDLKEARKDTQLVNKSEEDLTAKNHH